MTYFVINVELISKKSHLLLTYFASDWEPKFELFSIDINKKLIAKFEDNDVENDLKYKILEKEFKGSFAFDCDPNIKFRSIICIKEHCIQGCLKLHYQFRKK